MGALLKNFHSSPTSTTTIQKSVSFAPNGTKEKKHLKTYQLFHTDKSAESSKQFMQPTVCTICAECIAAVVGAPDKNYSHLLLTLLRSYADKTLVKSVFSSLDANYYYLMQSHKDRRTLQQKLLILCTLLNKAARLNEEMSLESSEFTEDVLACMVVLITCGEVDIDSASMFFEELCKVW